MCIKSSIIGRIASYLLVSMLNTSVISTITDDCTEAWRAFSVTAEPFVICVGVVPALKSPTNNCVFQIANFVAVREVSMWKWRPKTQVLVTKTQRPTSVIWCLLHCSMLGFSGYFDVDRASDDRRDCPYEKIAVEKPDREWASQQLVFVLRFYQFESSLLCLLGRFGGVDLITLEGVWNVRQ